MNVMKSISLNRHKQLKPFKRIYIISQLILQGHWPYELSVHQWSRSERGSIPRSHTKDVKMVIDAAMPKTQQYKVRIKGKVE